MQHRSIIISVTHEAIAIAPGSRFRAAMALAIVADALQLIVFPLFIEGAVSPVDDVLDIGVAAVMVGLLGWHWEFLPSVLGKLVPGVDLIPFWTLAVANVYRRSKRIVVATAENCGQPGATDVQKDVEEEDQKLDDQKLQGRKLLDGHQTP